MSPTAPLTIESAPERLEWPAALAPQRGGHAEAMLVEIAALFSTHTVEADREVFREGDAADKFYLIVRGRVAASKRLGDTETRLRK